MQIFLGYAREDIEHAKEVAACLKDAGYNVWRDGDLLVGGDNWDAERLAGQKAADFIIHLLSPVIDRRRSVAMREIRETLRLLEDEPFGSNLAMFMRLEDYRVPTQLTVWHYVDKFRDGWQVDLLRAVEKRVGQLALRNIAAAPPPIKDPMQEQAAEPITSKPVEISEGREGFTSRASYLKYRSKTPFWKLVNATLASRALSHHVGWEAQYAVVIDDIPPVDRDIDLWQEVAISESFREGEILSFRVYFHHYLGGAHPNHNVDSINFFGGEGGLVTIRDLLHYDDEAAKALVDLCYDRIMAVHEVDEEGTLTTREEMRAEAWQRLDRKSVV